ncbi:hypothetical protein [Frigidibacter oleivorans]|uniref:hypothetical protein n=1 Tax=Frigidibacter oleivorans TaxID=2487129 RepID=UPI000F8F19D9|nr:hypothetical protein [Frigidibacter oleivorans]
MHHASATVVAALLYREPMVGEFERLVEQFDRAFRDRPRTDYRHLRPYDDFALFAIDGARISLAHCADPMLQAAAAPGPDRARSALVIAVSFGIAEGLPVVLAERREALCRSLVEKVQAVFPADEVLWSETGGAFGPDEFDDVVRELCREAQEAPAAEDAIARAEAARQRAAARRNAAAQVVANDLPDLPHPMRDEAARIRQALYADPAAANPNLPQRLTLYAMDMALVVAVLPVGLALLTYNAFGKEDLRLTARAMSLTGIGFAFAGSPLAQTVGAYF